MAKKVTEKIKEGVSVEEIEKFARKYTNEVFLILALIIATISSVFGFFTGPSWSLIVAGLLAIIGIALPVQVGKFLKKLLTFQAKAPKTTIIIIGIVRIVLAVFIPFILFAEIGLLAGYAFHTTTKESHGEEHHLEEHHSGPNLEERQNDEEPPNEEEPPKEE
ncbi:MAG: hypothetical protein KR126chlam4_00316 [Candidatus Anoxychlamydiales bacterium]|nr:hypothetical protein [Candidatus Anoxychlamydiales bacterium]HEU64016.1 hypothetical protein [Chlamydiota bacterium]